MTTVITYPSLASIKIGGMKEKEKRIPLYGSIRFSVNGKEEPIYTKTKSIVSEDFPENIVYINKERVEGKPKQRVEQTFNELLKRANARNLHFSLESENIGYPTGGGLASSAAGLGAATLSLYDSLKKITDFYLDKKDLSRIARLGSSTAIGSIVGSYSELKVSEDDAWGEKIAEKDALPDLSITIALIEGGEESDLIHRAMENSRYKQARLDFVKETLPKVRRAVTEGDIESFINFTHEDTKNYHGAILDQGIMTFEAQTIPIFRTVEDMRKENKSVGISIAGGPIPIILSTRDEKKYVLSRLQDSLIGTKPIEVEVVGEPRFLND
jgi:diphosphomevalonate decarboxylase